MGFLGLIAHHGKGMRSYLLDVRSRGAPHKCLYTFTLASTAGVPPLPSQSLHMLQWRHHLNWRALLRGKNKSLRSKTHTGFSLFFRAACLPPTTAWRSCILPYRPREEFLPIVPKCESLRCYTIERIILLIAEAFKIIKFFRNFE